jgi:hypothetical protein
VDRLRLLAGALLERLAALMLGADDLGGQALVLGEEVADDRAVRLAKPRRPHQRDKVGAAVERPRLERLVDDVPEERGGP